MGEIPTLIMSFITAFALKCAAEGITFPEIVKLLETEFSSIKATSRDATDSEATTSKATTLEATTSETTTREATYRLTKSQNRRNKRRANALKKRTGPIKEIPEELIIHICRKHNVHLKPGKDLLISGEYVKRTAPLHRCRWCKKKYTSDGVCDSDCAKVNIHRKNATAWANKEKKFVVIDNEADLRKLLLPPVPVSVPVKSTKRVCGRKLYGRVAPQKTHCDKKCALLPDGSYEECKCNLYCIHDHVLLAKCPFCC